MSVTQQSAARNLDGRMQLVWIDANQVRTKWEQADGTYTADQNLGPSYTMDGSKPISISMNKAACLTVVCWSAFGVRVAIGQVAPNGGWYSTWTPFP